MKETQTNQERLMEMARGQSMFTAREVRDAGIATSVLTAAVASGELERVNRGVYRHVDASWDENLNISEVAAMAPQAVIVLLSALNFHGIGTHPAHHVWIQLKNNAVTPRIEYPPIEVVRTSVNGAFSEGVECHELNGINVPVTTPSRTVADCFKHRSKLGLELCLEALKEILQSGIPMGEILPFARMNRVENVMMPYLESLS